jgi:hypothetical protein
MAVQTKKILEKAISTGVVQPAILLLAKQTINLNTTSDQEIPLRGGDKFMITDIVITNVSVTPFYADDGEWWTGQGRSGVQLFGTIEGIGVAQFQEFTSPAYAGSVLCINNQNYGPFIQVTPANIANTNTSTLFNTAGSTVYFSMGSANQTPCTADMYIYGTILS